MFCCGSNGLTTFRERAVCGISCINPMAPFRETALGLKLDSTFTTARTRFGSTLWRLAACSIAALMSAWVKNVLRAGLKRGASDLLPRYWLTSAAAERAARMVARRTGLNRCSELLQ